MITQVILPNGQTLSSGTPGQAAICSFSYTAAVCPGQELEPGGCCAAMVQLEVLGSVPLAAGDEITVFRGEKLGVFIVTEMKTQNGVLSVTAYDRVTRLDREITGLTGSSLPVLADTVCSYCGLELVGALPFDQLLLQPPSRATGRQLLQWMGQLAGCFFRADPEGRICADWFKPGQDPTWCYRSAFEGYTVTAVEKVQLQSTAADVGAVYPDVPTGNTFVIRGNPLLQPDRAVAQHLYDLLKEVTYTPGRLTVAEETPVWAGDVIHFGGKRLYVMQVQLRDGKKELIATGSPHRDSSAAVNNVTLKTLSGQMLELDTRVEGLRAEHKTSDGRISKLTMDMQGLAATVSAASTAENQRMTKLEQTAQQLQLQVQTAAGQVVTGTGYTFDSEGLRIARSDAEMENRLDHSGMYVHRAGEPILSANSSGVVATDVRVRNYLHVGSHCRFEDYAGRTACFYIGGTEDEF